MTDPIQFVAGDRVRDEGTEGEVIRATDESITVKWDQPGPFEPEEQEILLDRAVRMLEKVS